MRGRSSIVLANHVTAAPRNEMPGPFQASVMWPWVMTASTPGEPVGRRGIRRVQQDGVDDVDPGEMVRERIEVLGVRIQLVVVAHGAVVAAARRGSGRRSTDRCRRCSRRCGRGARRSVVARPDAVAPGQPVRHPAPRRRPRPRSTLRPSSSPRRRRSRSDATRRRRSGAAPRGRASWCPVVPASRAGPGCTGGGRR